jgi:hypothetical protein
MKLTKPALARMDAVFAAYPRVRRTQGRVMLRVLFCLVAALLAARSGAQPPVSTQKWTTHVSREGGFAFDYPQEWRFERGEGHLHAFDRNDSVHLFVSGFKKPGESLEAFARLRFGVQADLFTRIETPHGVAGDGWQGLLEEADDLTPSRKENTRRVLLCAKRNDLFVTVALYLEPQEWAKRRTQYDRIFESLRFVKQ